MKTRWWVMSAEWWVTPNAPQPAVTQNSPLTTYNP